MAQQRYERMSVKRHIAVLAMVVMMVMAGGCAGFGTDGPVDDSEADADEQEQDQTQSEDGGQADDDGSDSGATPAVCSGTQCPSVSDDGDSGDDTADETDKDTDSKDSKDFDSGDDSKGTDDAKDSDDSKDGDDSKDDDGDDSKDGDGDGDDSKDDDTKDDDDEPYGTLTVTVVDESGEPVEGLEVVGIGPGGDIYSAESDENGQAQFDLSDGDYEFYVPDNEQNAHVEDVTGDEESTITMDGDDADLTLTVRHVEQEPTPETHTLTVDVTGPDGEPLADADVSVVTYDGGEPVDSGTTDENGQATFEVPNGDYEVSVSKEGYGQPSDQRLVTVDGEDATRTIQMESVDQDPDMYTYELTIEVVDDTEDANPVADEPVLVSVPPGEPADEYSTDENGEVTISFENSEPGDAVEHEVQVRDETRYVHVMEGPQTETFTVETENGGNGNGDDAETHTLTVEAGTPVTVERADGEGEPTTTEPTDGVAEFEVESGDYIVSAEGYMTKDILTIDGDQHLVMQDTDGATLEITAVDSESGEPIEGAEISGVCDVYHNSADEYLTTDAPSGEDGVITAQAGVTPTACDANVGAEGYEETVVSISVPDDDGLTVELTPTEDGGDEQDAQAQQTSAALTAVAP